MSQETPENNVKSLVRAAYRKRLEHLAAQQSVDEADFADAVYTAQSAFGIEEQAFRDMFGLTAGAVERWTQRKNLPQPGVRPKILGWLLGKI
ncbi:MAG: hypothetical protein GC185_00430 [Alphaproteobacteria bacterium]|nr:hypothetical protein [Alphaproteobacteria bacterium]